MCPNMSAYALPTTFKALPPIKALKKESTAAAAATTTAPVMPAAAPSTIVGISLPPLKLPKANDNKLAPNDFPKTPTRQRYRRGSTTAAANNDDGDPDRKTTDPSIWVEFCRCNVHLLTMSPRKIIRRGLGSGGGGLAYSPRRQARTVGGNGILDAVEVVFTITSSGRTYQATRSLARIVELSSDLIADAMEDEDVAAIPIFPNEVKLMPSLVPPPSPSSSMAGGGGLVSMQDRLDSVRDMLNVWFCRLLSSIDGANSIALSAFLWEPIWLTESEIGGSASNGTGIGGVVQMPKTTSKDSNGSVGDVPLVQSLSNDSSQGSSSTCSKVTNTGLRPNTASSYSTGALLPLAFGPSKSWKPARVRRGSADSVSTLSSIDETLLF